MNEKVGRRGLTIKKIKVGMGKEGEAGKFTDQKRNRTVEWEKEDNLLTCCT